MPVQGVHDLDEVYDDEAVVEAQADEHRPPVSVEGADEPEVESVIVSQLATNCSSLF